MTEPVALHASAITQPPALALTLDSVSKSYPVSGPLPARLPAVSDISLDIYSGELLTVFGPNGCGKTTLLNMLAGLLHPDSGTIRRHGSSGARIGYVFQNYADTLLPWRTVHDNLGLPLELLRVDAAERTTRIWDHLTRFGLTEHAHKYPYQLSGGLKQLLAIARATIHSPDLLVLDEPFSALDYSLSRSLWLRFREFWTVDKVTTVLVSHNPDEAVFLGDRVCVLSARPARLITVVPVPFGRTRASDLPSSPVFFSVRKQVLDAFERGRSP